VNVHFAWVNLNYGLPDLASQLTVTRSSDVWCPEVFQRLMSQLFFTSLSGLSLAFAPRFEYKISGLILPPHKHKEGGCCTTREHHDTEAVFLTGRTVHKGGGGCCAYRKVEMDPFKTLVT